jgi:hypothetical protein
MVGLWFLAGGYRVRIERQEQPGLFKAHSPLNVLVV